MPLFLIAMGLVTLAGLIALAAGSSARWSTLVGAGGAVVGCTLGLVSVLQVALGQPAQALRLPWAMPGATFHVELDALSGFFLAPTLLLAALAAIYGIEYLRSVREKKNLGVLWCCFDLLVVSMAMVMIARDGLLFLVAWETMALVSFFLIAFEHEKAEVRKASWIYLVATHIGTAFLLVMFLLLAREAGSFDFDSFGRARAAGPALVGLVFVLGVVGFGTKAGFVPLHVWLPEAHPAAPSHVSAVMSGVMIKTGLYGLLRLLTLLGFPPAWWGWLLVGIGVSSGVLGVLFALAQHDLKRLLAYHSVENIGIITLGIGLGLLGVSLKIPALAVLGFAGGLLHVLNHALFKGLLFLGAGAVLHATGTREIDHLGGLAKGMPRTSLLFVIGAAAISGLPPLNGFVSELLIYLGAFSSIAAARPLVVLVPAVIGLAGLALIGGLAAACFTKASGMVFLGEPRSHHAEHAHEPSLSMQVPMMILAAGCIVIGLLPAAVVPALAAATLPLVGPLGGVVVTTLAQAAKSLGMITLAAGVLLLVVAALTVWRRWLLVRRPVEESVTWDCGYAHPTTRMQYTASSYAQPLTALFALFLRTRQHLVSPQGIFPSASSLSTETPDLFSRGLFAPLFARAESALSRLRVVQLGRVQIYVLYIVVALLSLMIWKVN